MQIAEPMTMFTDYLLGAYTLYVAVQVLRLAKDNASQHLWGLSLLVAGVGTLIGGSMHGFRPMIGESAAVALWLMTLASGAIAAFFMLRATAADRLPKFRRIIDWVAGVKLALTLGANAIYANFAITILDYASAMLFVLAVYAWSWRRDGDKAARFICLGVMASFVAAGVQMTGITFHEYFNYNDLYHLTQIGAMYLFYRGIRGLGERNAAA